VTVLSPFIQQLTILKVFYAYTFGTATWLSIQALPLLVAPKLITTMLSSEAHSITGEPYRRWQRRLLQSQLTVPVDLETYFCRSFAFSLLLVATIMLFFTGSIPLSSSITEPISTDDSDPKAPYAVPIVRITTLFHTASLTYCYIRYVNSGQVGFALGAVGYGLLAAMGLWCVLFATSGGKISRRTGADERTSGFPFKNAEAYNKKRDKKLT
jgi:hypothetical protein